MRRSIIQLWIVVTIIRQVASFLFDPLGNNKKHCNYKRNSHNCKAYKFVAWMGKQKEEDTGTPNQQQQQQQHDDDVFSRNKNRNDHEISSSYSSSSSDHETIERIQPKHQIANKHSNRRIFSVPDTDFLPRRRPETFATAAMKDRPTSSSSSLSSSSSSSMLLEEWWGIERRSLEMDSSSSSLPVFPVTFDDVAEAAFQAIAGTLYGKQKLDPSLVSNVMARNTLIDYRPSILPPTITTTTNDSNSNNNDNYHHHYIHPRLGIEIDGTQFLSMTDRPKRLTSGSAMRRLVLLLAAKLSHVPWTEFEEENNHNNNHNDNDNDDKDCHYCDENKNNDADVHVPKEESYETRPVAVYFNTVQQALSARRQLTLLQQHHHHQQKQNQKQQEFGQNITIMSLGQDDDLPLQMRTPLNTYANTEGTNSKKEQKRRGRRRRKGQEQQSMMNNRNAHPVKGIVIVVQPTDFNREHRPPGPAFGLLSSLQKLVARAATEGLAVVMVSPRFAAATTDHYNRQHSHDSKTTGTISATSQPYYNSYNGPSPWDYQTLPAAGHQAAAYGGMEPPRMPLPWILRDFIPPIYCWIGNALILNNHEKQYLLEQQQLKQKQQELRQQQEKQPLLSGYENSYKSNNDNRLCDHEMKRLLSYRRLALTQSVMNEGHPWQLFAGKSISRDGNNNDENVEHEFLAETKSFSGRPTHHIMRQILLQVAATSSMPS